eukprot:2884488-Amphidinium_carterae.1
MNVHSDEQDPYLPFGNGSNRVIAWCMASGVTGAYFSAYHSSLGILILQAWGVYVTYVFLLVRYEDYQPSAHIRNRSDLISPMGNGPMELWAGVILILLAVAMLARSLS